MPGPYETAAFGDLQRLLMQSGVRGMDDPLRRSLANTEGYAQAQGASDAAQRGLQQNLFNKRMALSNKARKAQRKGVKDAQKYSALGTALGVAGGIVGDELFGGGAPPPAGGQLPPGYRMGPNGQILIDGGFGEYPDQGIRQALGI